MQSIPIAPNVVSSNTVYGEWYSIQHYVFVCLVVLNAIFNNISVISWRSVLLVEDRSVVFSR